MNTYLVFRFLHFVGVVLWIGGVVAAASAAYFGASRTVSAAARRLNVTVATPGMIAAWVGGLGMLVPNFGSFYAKQGWMHGKLLLVFVAAGLSGVISGTLRRASDTDEQPASKLRTLALVLVTILFIVVGLAVFKPGARPV